MPIWPGAIVSSPSLPSVTPNTGTVFESSAPDRQLAASGDGMKSKRKKKSDELRPEYDFSKLGGGVRGKYVERYRRGTNLVRLDRDVAEAFPTDSAVNRTLRAALTVSDAVRSEASNKRVERTRSRRAGHGRATGGARRSRA